VGPVKEKDSDCSPYNFFLSFIFWRPEKIKGEKKLCASTFSFVFIFSGITPPVNGQGTIAA
jgi:hypothetical protein